METINQSSVTDRVKLQNLLSNSTEAELIEKYHNLKMDLADTIAVWKRVSKSGNFATTYNKIGVMLKTNVPVVDCSNLETVKTHRQFVFAGDNERKMIKSIKLELAYRYNLPVFKSGKLYIQTEFFLKNLFSK